MTNSLSLKKSAWLREQTTLYIILSMVFVVWPLFGIFCSLCWALSANLKERVWPFMLLLSLYLCAINSTKVPESDMIRYIEMFSQAPNNGLEGTIKFWDDYTLKEIVYGTFVYLSYFILDGCPGLFIAVVTFLTYFFLFRGIYLMDNENKKSNYIFVAAAISIAFFSQYFTLTAHLIRQLLATSIFLYAISLRINNQRIHWLWLAVAFSVHNAIGVLIALSLIPYVRKRLNIITLFILLGMGVLFGIFFSQIANVIERYIDSYALQRASAAEGASDGIEIDVIASIIVFVPLGIISLINSIKRRSEISPIYSNLTILLILLVASLSFSPLLQYRFFFFAYSFIPFIIPHLFKNGTIVSKLYCTAFSCFFIARFFYTFEGLTWDFAPLEVIVFAPYWELVQIQIQ